MWLFLKSFVFLTLVSQISGQRGSSRSRSKSNRNNNNNNNLDYVEECPERFGFYADAVQCDRYYECKDGQVRKYRVLHTFTERYFLHNCVKMSVGKIKQGNSKIY